jgi:membrane associated rhomboid family serine protease
MFGSLVQDLKFQVKSGNIVTRLILINVGVFVLINLVRLTFFLMGNAAGTGGLSFDEIVRLIAMPYDGRLVLYRPWTLFTSIFFHMQFGHILMNMLLLFWFGRIMHDFSRQRILFVYLAGGVFASLFSFTFYHLLPLGIFDYTSHYALGASGAVTAIMMATATLVPEYQIGLLFIGPVRIKYFVLVVLVIDLFSIAWFDNAGGHLAHLGGALFGFLYMTSVKKGYDWMKVFNFRKKGSLRVAHSGDRLRGLSKREIQHRIDEILDKINKSGYDSLTKEEKEDWFKLSNKV